MQTLNKKYRGSGNGGRENFLARIDTFMWTTFNNWLKADTQTLLRLLEVSSDFPRTEVNEFFYQQIDRLRRQVSPDVHPELEAAKRLDFVGYIARTLRNAGFRDADIDPLTQDVVVRLLVEPGKLVLGWQGHPGTFLPRVKKSIKNAVLNLLDKHQRRRRKFQPATPEEVDIFAYYAAPERADHTIKQFRQQVQERLGTLALAVLDARLDGADVKSLIGLAEFGSPTSYKIKQVVQQIKALAATFGDESFRAMVSRALDAEQQTLARRFGSLATAVG
ncbi:MAG: hypothetical protein RBS80_25425 [Thermoguttaceae bacterium]|nr:hypothetical protein [Thermoguttaceae bacterium]